MLECIKSCSNNCKSEECQEICLDCNDPDSCAWVERTSENTKIGSDADVPSRHKFVKLMMKVRFYLTGKKPDSMVEI